MTTIKSKLLAEYSNGSNFVKIYEDGTKVRDWNGPNEFPDHCDVKITDFCEGANCPFCHEKSTKRGLHGDLDLVLDMWKDLPAGVELAIGGGNPLDHPKLIPFLQELKNRGQIANITINQLHLDSHSEIIEKIIRENLIKGMGISIRNVDEMLDLYPCGTFFYHPHIVYHLIAGIHSFQDYQKLSQTNEKFLILGYKEFGFGAKYKERSFGLDDKINSWRRNLPLLMTSDKTVSFDNLAIKQLDLRRYFGKKEWEEKYMGDDGEFSFYVDAVKKEFGLNSCATERFAINGTAREMFQELKKNLTLAENGVI